MGTQDLEAGHGRNKKRHTGSLSTGWPIIRILEHRLAHYQNHTGSKQRRFESPYQWTKPHLWKPDWGFLAHARHEGSLPPLLPLGPSQPSQTLDAQDTPEVTPRGSLHSLQIRSQRDSKSPSGHLAGREQVSPTDWSLPPAMERGPVPQGEWAGETLCEVVWEDGGGAGSMTAPDKCSHSVYSARRPRVPWRPSQDERPAGADDEAHGRAGQAGEQQRAAPDCQCGALSSRQVRRSGGGHRAGVPLGC